GSDAARSTRDIEAERIHACGDGGVDIAGPCETAELDPGPAHGWRGYAGFHGVHAAVMAAAAVRSRAAKGGAWSAPSAPLRARPAEGGSPIGTANEAFGWSARSRHQPRPRRASSSLQRASRTPIDESPTG